MSRIVQITNIAEGALPLGADSDTSKAILPGGVANKWTVQKEEQVEKLFFLGLVDSFRFVTNYQEAVYGHHEFRSAWTLDYIEDKGAYIIREFGNHSPPRVWTLEKRGRTSFIAIRTCYDLTDDVLWKITDV
ncbi:hypothetical protein EC991_009962 [Linnemannia zychae]|nr:hypothetical protein EC991_009962 [Linnemannia zychae]